MREFKAIARYIAENYPSAAKIVEVGIGHVPEVAAELQQLMPRCTVLVTDIQKPTGIPKTMTFIRDDITKPNLRVYQGAALIYAIRPSPELQPYILEAARKVGADLLIKPLAAESMPLAGGELVNFEGVAFHVFKLKSAK